MIDNVPRCCRCRGTPSIPQPELVSSCPPPLARLLVQFPQFPPQVISLLPQHGVLLLRHPGVLAHPLTVPNQLLHLVLRRFQIGIDGSDVVDRVRTGSDYGWSVRLHPPPRHIRSRARKHPPSSSSSSPLR